MVDLDHCSYATIWAGDKDCYRGNICYLFLACSFFLWLLLLLLPSPPLDPHCRFPHSPSISFSTRLFYSAALCISTWTRTPPCCVLHLSQLCSLSHHSPPPPCNPPLCVSSSPSIPPSLCIESGAAWLSLPPCWAGACLKGPRILTHWGSPAMPEMPSLSSSPLSPPLPLISVHLAPLHLCRIEEKVKLCLSPLSSLLIVITYKLISAYLWYIY